MNSTHKVFFFFLCVIYTKHICASLARQTFCFCTSSEHFFYIPFSCFKAIRMNCLYDEEGSFPVPHTLALIFTYFCRRGKKFETHQVEIYQDQVCLSYCNIEGIQ